MMNEKADEIGMTSTNFFNSSGLNDPDNYSTVKRYSNNVKIPYRKLSKFLPFVC